MTSEQAADYLASIPVAGPLISASDAPGGHYIEAPLRQLGRGLAEGTAGAAAGGLTGALIGALLHRADLGARIGAGVGGVAGMAHGHLASRRNMRDDIAAALMAQNQENPVFKELASTGVKEAKEKDLADKAVAGLQIAGGGTAGGVTGGLLGLLGGAAVGRALPPIRPSMPPGVRPPTGVYDPNVARQIALMLLGGATGTALGSAGGAYGAKRLVDAGDAELVPNLPMAGVRGALGGLGLSTAAGALEGGLGGAFRGAVGKRALIAALLGAGLGTGRAYLKKRDQENEIRQAYGYPG